MYRFFVNHDYRYSVLPAPQQQRQRSDLEQTNPGNIYDRIAYYVNSSAYNHCHAQFRNVYDREKSDNHYFRIRLHAHTHTYTQLMYEVSFGVKLH